MCKKYFFIVLISCLSIKGQGQINADSLFNAAIEHSKNNDYNRAIEDANTVLSHYPDRIDIVLFLANVSAWRGSYPDSKLFIERAFKINPKNPELYDAWLNVLLWNNEFNELLKTTKLAQENGYSNSYNILLKEVLALKGLKEYQRAIQEIHQNSNYRDSASISSLYYELLNLNRQNIVSVFYSIDIFEKNGPKPQHLSYIDYGVNLRGNTLLVRGYFANRFNISDYQIEIDYYQNLRKGRYIYSSYGISILRELFPNHRAGLEYYTLITKNLEISAGGRFLNFNNTSVFILTGHLGSYLGNWWIAARPFYTIKNDGHVFSATGNVRFYGPSGVDYWGLEFGYGNSPDEKNNAFQLADNLLLHSFRIKIEKNMRITKSNNMKLTVSWVNEEQAARNFQSRIRFEIFVNHKF